MAITIGLRHLFYAASRRRAHDEWNTLILRCTCRRELSVTVEYTLHADRSNEDWGGMFDPKYRGLHSRSGLGAADISPDNHTSRFRVVAFTSIRGTIPYFSNARRLAR
jgi:hypothetical protein